VRYSWIGKTITELDIRRKYRLNIIAVKVGNELNIMPGPDYCFSEHDHVVVISTAEDVNRLSKL
jgi:trk system potassium uptake protein TrkA